MTPQHPTPGELTWTQPRTTPTALHGGTRVDWIGAVLVALVLSPLLVGFEPVGGDPDRIFRPIKFELASALRTGTLPFWSDRLGLGFPLVAESHAAALYPPNWLLYRFLDVNTAYRASMWLHMVGIALVLVAYTRSLGLRAWSCGIASLAFTLGGFLSIHSSHEWAYHGAFYLVLILLCVDRYALSGRVVWLAALALACGMAWCVGHFQIAAWSLPIAAFLGLWRAGQARPPAALTRSLALSGACAWGLLIAAAQLAPSWELARVVGQEQRDRMFYSYPPAHLVELAWPGLFRNVDPEDVYWFRHQSTGFEAHLFASVPALALACLGLAARRKGAGAWAIITLGSLCLATLPAWWPDAYRWVLAIPGIGLFRCPARWTLFSNLGIAVLAGYGLDRLSARAESRTRLWPIALVGAGLLGFGFLWFSGAPLPIQPPPLVNPSHITRTGLIALASWILTLTLMHAIRRKPVFAAGLVLVTFIELGWGFYHSTTHWGWSMRVPAVSPVLSELASDAGARLVGGVLDNLPVRAGLATASPYVGFTLDPVNALLRRVSENPRLLPQSRALRWLARLGVTHIVLDSAPNGVDARQTSRLVSLVSSAPDPALDVLARAPRSGKRWTVWRIDDSGPRAHLARNWRVLADERTAFEASFSGLETHTTAVAEPDLPRLSAPKASQATLIEWDGTQGTVRHDGACALVLNRIAYPGWSYRLEDGPWRPVGRAEGGLQALWIDGAGDTRIETRYEPTAWRWAWPTSLMASLLGAVGLLAGLAQQFRRARSIGSAHPHADAGADQAALSDAPDR